MHVFRLAHHPITEISQRVYMIRQGRAGFNNVERKLRFHHASEQTPILFSTRFKASQLLRCLVEKATYILSTFLLGSISASGSTGSGFASTCWFHSSCCGGRYTACSSARSDGRNPGIKRSDKMAATSSCAKVSNY